MQKKINEQKMNKRKDASISLGQWNNKSKYYPQKKRKEKKTRKK